MSVGPPVSRRWLMWSLPALLFLIAFFHRVAPGVIAKELMQSFDVGSSVVGLLAAAYFYSYAALMVPAGLFIDAWGVRRVVTAGGVLMGLGTLAMGVAGTTLVLFAGRLAVGLGAAVTFVGALKIAATWFPASQFATLSAITATVGQLGALVSTAPLAVLTAVAGWRGALCAVGVATLAVSLANFGVVRDRPAAALVATSGSALRPSPVGFRTAARGMGTVLGNPHTWPPFAAFFCLYSGFGNLALWAVPFLRDVYGLGTTRAAVVASATPLALLVTGPLTGFLSDRVLRRRKGPYAALAAAQCAVYAVLVLSLGALPLEGVVAVFFAAGLVGGAFVLTWPIGREVNPPHLAGVAVAVVNLGGFLGAAVTQGPIGAVLDARWEGALVDGARVYPLGAYRAAFTICAGFLLAGALAALMIRETRGQNVYRSAAPTRETR